MPRRSRSKRAAAPPEPPLDWLRQSVWAGEELPDELELLEMMEPASEPVKNAPQRSRAKPKKKL